MLHLEIIQERLSREFDQEVITTVPNVSYYSFDHKGNKTLINTPNDLPDPTLFSKVEELLYQGTGHHKTRIYRIYHDAVHGEKRHSDQTILSHS